MYNKQFKDPIYGYIEIDSQVVAGIIDTSTFQRLKDIRHSAEDAAYKPEADFRPITFAKVPTSGLAGARPVLQITWQDVNIQFTSNREAHLAAEVIAHLRSLC